MVQWCSDINRGIPKYTKKTCCRDTLSATNTTYPAVYTPPIALVHFNQPPRLSVGKVTITSSAVNRLGRRREADRKEHPKGVSETTGWRCEGNGSSGLPCALSIVMLSFLLILSRCETRQSVAKLQLVKIRRINCTYCCKISLKLFNAI